MNNLDVNLNKCNLLTEQIIISVLMMFTIISRKNLIESSKLEEIYRNEETGNFNEKCLKVFK